MDQQVIKLIQTYSNWPSGPELSIDQMVNQLSDLFTDESNKVKEERINQLTNFILSHASQTNDLKQFHKFFGSVSHEALIGQIIECLINNNMHTWNSGNIPIAMEHILVKRLCQLIGWTQFGDGIFLPGGTLSILQAMIVARQWLFPHLIEQSSDYVPRLGIFTSEECHYSLVQAAHILSIPNDHIFKIKINQEGSIDLNHLRSLLSNAINDGVVPFFVLLTAGTTMRNAFDPIKETVEIVREICPKYFQPWIHVDASIGGIYLFHPDKCLRFNGIEMVDSMHWDAHKLCRVGILCTVLLFRQKMVLSEIGRLRGVENYLYHQKEGTISDSGRKTIMCGREACSLRLFFHWAINGEEYFRERVSQIVSGANYMADLIDKSSYFVLMSRPSFSVILFDINPESGIALLEKDFQDISKKTGIDYAKISGKPIFRMIVRTNDFKRLDQIIQMLQEEIILISQRGRGISQQPNVNRKAKNPSPLIQIKIGQNTFLLKCEHLSSTLSIKDRMVEYILDRMDRTKYIGVCAASSGNTAIATARYCLEHNLSCYIFILKNTSIDKINMIKSYRANIFLEESGHEEKADQYCLDHSEIYNLDQYRNPLNPLCYSEIMVPEILEQIKSEGLSEISIDYLVCCASTGGTLVGLTKGLKEDSIGRNLQVILSDHMASKLPSLWHEQFPDRSNPKYLDPTAERKTMTEGAGKSYVTPILDLSLIDYVCVVSDQIILETIMELTEQFGLWVGGSSAIAYASAKAYAEGTKGKVFLIILPDHGNKYIRKFSD